MRGQGRGFAFNRSYFVTTPFAFSTGYLAALFLIFRHIVESSHFPLQHKHCVSLLCRHADRQENRQRVMGYIEKINELLVPNTTEDAVVLDLFAGCGGLSLGFEAAGYKTIGYEMNAKAAETYRRNLGSDCQAVKLDTTFEYPDAQIVIGGPPCQPCGQGEACEVTRGDRAHAQQGGDGQHPPRPRELPGRDAFPADEVQHRNAAGKHIVRGGRGRMTERGPQVAGLSLLADVFP